MMTPVLTIFGYGKLMHTDMSSPGVQWMPSRMKWTRACPLDFVKQTDRHQHSDRLLQEFYIMTQKHNESIGKYAVRLDIAAGKV